MPPGVLASVHPIKKGGKDELGPGWSLTIDVERIASLLPVFLTKSWRVAGYERQSLEARLQAFEQTLNSVLVHELVHVIQLAEDEDAKREAMHKEGKQIVRLVQAALASGLPAACGICENPEAAARYALGWFVVNACIISVSTTGIRQNPHSTYFMEEEAYEIQRIVADASIMKDPFQITHEPLLSNLGQPPSFITSLRPFN